MFRFERIFQTCQNLEEKFQKYDIDNLELIGRYGGDAYYDGQTWIICSLALVRYIAFNYLDNMNICTF